MARACKANDESCSVMVVNDPKKVEGTGGKVRWNRPERKGWRGPEALRRFSSKQAVGEGGCAEGGSFFHRNPAINPRRSGSMYLFDGF